MDNKELMINIEEMARKMENKWTEQVRRKERRILHIIFDRFARENGVDELTRQQFTQFKLTCPMEYQLRLTRIATDWETIAGEDGILQLDEFSDLLDTFADEVANLKHDRSVTTALQIESNDLRDITK